MAPKGPLGAKGQISRLIAPLSIVSLRGANTLFGDTFVLAKGRHLINGSFTRDPCDPGRDPL